MVSDQGSLAAKERRDRIEIPGSFFALLAFFCGQKVRGIGVDSGGAAYATSSMSLPTNSRLKLVGRHRHVAGDRGQVLSAI